jgi:hypothetical protein
MGWDLAGMARYVAAMAKIFQQELTEWRLPNGDGMSKPERSFCHLILVLLSLFVIRASSFCEFDLV